MILEGILPALESIAFEFFEQTEAVQPNRVSD